MSLDALKVIKEAEAQGDDIRTEALQKARELVLQAEANAEDNYVLLTRQFQDAGERELLMVRNETKAEIEKIQQQNMSICREIEEKAEFKLQEAVAFIMGRIVTSYGHN